MRTAKVIGAAAATVAVACCIGCGFEGGLKPSSLDCWEVVDFADAGARLDSPKHAYTVKAIPGVVSVWLHGIERPVWTPSDATALVKVLIAANKPSASTREPREWTPSN
jgi:hypothetical protein